MNDPYIMEEQRFHRYLILQAVAAGIFLGVILFLLPQSEEQPSTETSTTRAPVAEEVVTSTVPVTAAAKVKPAPQPVPTARPTTSIGEITYDEDFWGRVDRVMPGNAPQKR